MRAWVLATVRGGAQRAEEHRPLDQIIINRGIAETPDGATISFSDKESLYRAYEASLRAGQESGIFRNFDVRVMAIAQQGAVDAMIRYLNSHPEADPGHHAQALADLLLAAVRAP